MRKLIVFNHISLDGYFVDGSGAFGWARNGNDDPEYAAFVAENAGGDGQLLFGRVTYQLMAGYWPTPMAEQHDPAVAAGMNRMPKTVFSRTLDAASWSNTTLVKGDPVAAVRRMKEEPGPGMVLLGSGSIVAQLAPEHLIDEYQMMIDPVALGRGRSMFEGIPEMLSLRLAKSRTFRNGKIYLSYEPAA
ncbi:dihydrofolate reductase family protein [Paracidobacterium acidisoli]|uniref:Dihydrofolate reductase n=1 Tax=Paracidobacterium acidisoli TaxID=2303751 RepID=A0A372IPM5_9BACT|nr:dihydrofolate reductase family protein [Paracidobacterium acidisoli]MBT9331236.1 dihydrofolate reductase family protein [Paracidobacterium acidisoli]